MSLSITIIIIAITVVISIMKFNSYELEDALIFDPPAVYYRKQWYRFITCGFIHADIAHLAFNMYSLYLFGPIVEQKFIYIFGAQGRLIYLLMYLTSLAACLMPTYAQHKTNNGYRSLGASGAISAVSFCFMFLEPTTGIGFIFLPFYIPGFLFAIIYLVISSVLAKRADSHINHSAHIWGAIYGVAFLIFTCYVLSDYKVLSNFAEQVSGYISAKFH
ncbi:Membrane associated serine protease, rhomboid family [Filimonas lacunae]|uniref:Membrane associated serine protease, rhomboid family n=1 Tax=Filimonas lacunae TaxID=477680 RepID=A0A173MAV2_9BACT|nr:rhomboid family intramembrane serine protease [Filimonas lacunae]BAV04650.1 rhomboid family protein [Filimonas lacunae]SIT32498.1 Membrane associated serine protease, rhomboid family [Filimonas lacunae]